MEAISNLCASKEVVYKNHAKRAWCAHGGAPWRTNHENGRREEVLLAQNEKKRKAFCAHLCKVPKHEIHVQKEIWII
jgi:hypothetical protein